MDSDNNAPCFSLSGLEWLSAQIAKMLKYNHSMGLKKTYILITTKTKYINLKMHE